MVPLEETFKTGSSNEPASKVCPGTDNTSFTQWRQNTPESTSRPDASRNCAEKEADHPETNQHPLDLVRGQVARTVRRRNLTNGASRRKARERTVRREHLVRQAQVQGSTRQFDPSNNAGMSASSGGTTRAVHPCLACQRGCGSQDDRTQSLPKKTTFPKNRKHPNRTPNCRQHTCLRTRISTFCSCTPDA